MEDIDRNSKKELEKDVSFIDEILGLLENPTRINETEILLNDWKGELQNLLQNGE